MPLFTTPLSPLVAVLGPTGAGKSDLALYLTEHFEAEIVNCDSVQVYRGLEIGAAKVPLEQRTRVRHHLIDVIETDGELTAGEYARLGRAALTDIRDRGKIPIVAGGTGFYLRALLDGLSPAPRRDEDLRNRLKSVVRRRPGALHRFLHRLDPVSASRIHPNDYQKLIRAIELTALAGRPASQTQSEPRDALRGFAMLKLGLNPERARLHRKLDERSAAMFAAGLLEETRALIDAGVAPDSKALKSLGYKQAVQLLSGELTLEAAVIECRTKTRQYAKRQMTWFRAERGMCWLKGFGNEEAIRTEALRKVREFLGRRT